MKLSTMKTTTTRLLSISSHLHRHLTTTASPSKLNKWQLYQKVSGVGYTGEKVTDVLQKLTANGVHFEYSDLAYCFKKLRVYRRHSHCLEILDWMEKGDVESSHISKRLDLIYRVEGIHEAEKYFDSLPPAAKKPFMYGALLNCYCSEKMIVKATALFEDMDKLNYASSEVPFNSLMGLYMKVDQPEKVPPLIQEMKQRNIPISKNSYRIWLQSYGRLKNIEGVEEVMDEVKGQSFLEDDWKIYSTLASAYISAGHSQRAGAALKRMEEVLDHSNYSDRFAYHHLISLYGNIGDLESVLRAWDKLNLKFPVCHNMSYRVMLQTLSKLENIKGLQKCFKEWESRCKTYDVRLTRIVIVAYLNHNMVEEAKLLLKDAAGRSGQDQWGPHIAFGNYYLRKHQIDSALSHVKLATAQGWKPEVENLDLFFEYFKEQKDVHGAERLCSILKKVDYKDARTYFWLLQIYAAADKTEPGFRQRMEEDNISISEEHEELLSKVCPSS